MQKASVSIFLNNAENLQNEFEIGSTNMEGKTGKTENSKRNSHYGRGGRLILPGVQGKPRRKEKLFKEVRMNKQKAFIRAGRMFLIPR